MIVIGGEHYFEPKHFLKKTTHYLDTVVQNFKQQSYYVNFTFGGYFSLLAIIDHLSLEIGIDQKILLPSYLCPSIIKPFKIRSLNYDFYKVDQDLNVDYEHLTGLIDKTVKAVLFIDYFGIQQKNPVINTLKEGNIIIIQDAVQCLDFENLELYGDYVFNSFRKFFPYEGSLLLSKNEITIDLKKTHLKYLIFKRLGQITRYAHIQLNLLPSQIFLFFLKKAETCYQSSSVYGMPKFNKKGLNKIEIEHIIKTHKYYYKQLYHIFKDKMPSLLRNENVTPLGLIIRTNNRDIIRKNLFSNKIYTPIHWELSEEIDNEIFRKSKELSSKILTIPIISLNDTKYSYLLENLNNQFKNESIY